MVTEESLEFERRTWTALTSSQDAVEYYDRVLGHDMVMALPGMVLDRAEAVESWVGSVPWRDVEIEDVRRMSLGRGVALLT